MKIRLSVISFTENGRKLSTKIKNEIQEQFPQNKMEVCSYTKQTAGKALDGQPDIFVDSPLEEWTGLEMQKKHALLFIGACGIAVRAIAPHLTDKLQDVPVLVMDELGNYVIPVLSGHMGGANELAHMISELTGAKPVITTATDLNEVFSVDLFAKKHGLFIGNKEGIAKVSAKSLSGEEIMISVETGHLAVAGAIVHALESHKERIGEGKASGLENVKVVPYPPTKPVDVIITSATEDFDALLTLKPKEYVIGFGCKKGIPETKINDLIVRTLKNLGISLEQVFAISSIVQKQHEEGIVEWCRKERIPFVTYTANELQRVKGKFQSSSFVEKQVGVDNVCERAAIKACGTGGILISGKYADSGMTIAVAKRKWSVDFDEK